MWIHLNEASVAQIVLGFDRNLACYADSEVLKHSVCAERDYV